jgi:hypothetical protein
VRAAPARLQHGMTICESESNSKRAALQTRRGEWSGRRDRWSTEREECARDHVLAFVVSLFSARHTVGAYALSVLTLSILSPRFCRSNHTLGRVTIGVVRRF